MKSYRNEIYWQKYNPEFYKTIVIIYKNEDVLTYIDNYEKNIDYICNIKLSKKYEKIENISIEKIIEMPITYNIVIDEINSENKILIKQFHDKGFTLYLYKNNILENYKYLNQDIKDNIFKYTNRISIELSNICNYSKIHIRCPLNKSMEEKKILSLNIIKKIIDEIAKNNFSGVIAFHTYNEPLIDPRLFYIINLVKNKCKKAKMFLLSNGYYFNQTIANELVEIGVDRIDITAYTRNKYDQLKKINIPISYSIFPSFNPDSLDTRLNIYDSSILTKKSIFKPCYNILNDMIITCDARISLCCLDWQRKYCFGDLNKQSIKEIILNTDIFKEFKNLAKGNREREICKNCIISETKRILNFNFNGITYRKEGGCNCEK